MTPRVVTDPPAPGSPEWQTKITASKVPVILGLSPFKSPYAMWHEMAGNITPEGAGESRPDWEWGHDVEDALANWWKRHHKGWRTNHREIAYEDPALPFPNLVTLDRRAARGRARRIIECKTARDMDQWGRPGEPDSVPAHYAAQVTAQMGVSGIHRADVVVLGPFGVPEIHPVPWDPEVWEMIATRCAEWHASLAAGTPPPLDDTTATYEAVRRLHPDIDRDATVQVDPAQARAYLTADRIAKRAETIARGRKTRMLATMGRARRAMVGDTVIATRAASGKSVRLTPSKKDLP